MIKRLFDIFSSSLGLIAFFPVLLFAGIGVKLCSQGPIFHKAKRAGKFAKPFYLFKLRTMHLDAEKGSPITAINDERIFTFGAILRNSKIDELPQLFNVLIGEMSIVGPRPEAISIVEKYYDEAAMTTLDVNPGIASPGSLFNYTHSSNYLTNNAEIDYVENFLPIKLALETVYLDNKSILYDLEIVCRTAIIIFGMSLGKRDFPLPREYIEAQRKNLIT